MNWNGLTRRNFLRLSGSAAGAALFAANYGFPFKAFAQATQTSDFLANYHAMGAKTLVKVTPLRGNVSLLQGVGGNMAALVGGDGKLLVDSSVSTAAPHVQEALGTLGSQPLRILVNTHWHFDHTEGNEAMHNAGAVIMAHRNTRLRMSSVQEVRLLGLHFEPSPAAALPQQIFDDRAQLFFNGEEIAMVYFKPAHTDSDIYVHFKNANVLHVADTWFNGFYPVIDDSSGGNINGMIAASEIALALADNETKIIPGHGPLGDKAALKQYHDMMATVRDRVQKQKSAGKSPDEVVAANPTADFDAQWGNGMMKPAVFVGQVYKTL